MSPTETPKRRALVLMTERQIYAFDLAHTIRVAIGRHESNDLQLASLTVSNFHAEVLIEDGAIVLRDLGSTNGTFVNDERVKSRRLEEGDRVRVGNHVLTMHLEAPASERQAMFPLEGRSTAFGPGTKGQIISIRANSDEAHRTLQSRGPHDLSLADLLKILSTNARSIRIVLSRGEERACTWLKKDRVVHAEYGSATGEKALYRLFGWREARYELAEHAEGAHLNATIDLPTDTLIVEGMKHAGEVGKLAASLPPLEAPLRLKESCPLPVSAYSPAELEMFQSIIRHETIGRILETSSLTDLRVLRLVEALLRKGAFEVMARSEAALLESTFVSRGRVL